MLKVWLPLTGTLENKGISNVTITNNGATVNASGKIGSCYYFDGSAYMTTTSPSGIKSVCFWLKTSKASSKICFADYKSKMAFGFYTSNNMIVSCSGRSIQQYTNSAAIADNTWTHITLVDNSTDILLYINGILQTARTSANNWTHSTDTLELGRRSSGSNMTCYMNDFRAYDHCLSAAEVHEISQGLVLHYKLDGFNNASMLPPQYQQLEYIESSGTSYFNTGCKFNIETDACKVIFKGNDTSNNGMILASNSSKYFWFYYYGSNGIRVYGNNGSAQQGVNGGNNNLNDHTMEFKNKTYYLDGANKGSLSNTYTETTHNLWLFDRGNNVNPFKGRIYYAEIIRNGTKQRAFIPAKRLTDSVAGMYDLITNTFYVSSNSAFTAGTAVGTLAIQDSSGYGHNGTITGNVSIVSNSGRYSNCIYTPSGNTDYITTPTLQLPGDAITMSFWFKSSNTSPGSNYHMPFEGTASSNQSYEMSIYKTGYLRGGLVVAGSRKVDNCTSTKLTDGNWHMCTMTYDGSTIKRYVDGVMEKSTSATGALVTSSSFVLGHYGSNISYYSKEAYTSDARIYCTALSADDIFSLYQTSAKIDNLNGFHTFEAVERASNIFFKIDSARGAKVFQDGLSRYTQTNCQVTLTDDGYRIYRPPNLTTANNGNTMWGGLKLVNQSTDTVAAYDEIRDNIWKLQDGHTYMAAFHVKGQTTNAVNWGWNHNMGNGVSVGVTPEPTVLVNQGIPTNFEGEKDCFYIFTIGDTVIKTSTTTRTSAPKYQKDVQYLSYRHMTFGFGYSSTGTLGTDLYLTNFRLYDITNEIGQIKKNGQAIFNDFVENNSIVRILKNSEFITNNLIEK